MWAFLKSIISLVGGLGNGVLQTALSIMKEGSRAAVQFHEEAISFSRDLGLGLRQSNAYTKALTEDTAKLARTYGVTANAIKEVQRNIADATGKQILLNTAQREQLVQANKLVGAQTAVRFEETMMNGFGAQINTVYGAIAKAYGTAAKSGLAAQKFSQKIADNLSMANRLNFRNGIDGLIRMTAMSEKLGMNLQSVETVANNFMDLSSAIEKSANLQMLGGTIGVSFANPLEAAYESWYDPEALARRQENALRGMATFDEAKGMAVMGGMNQNILKEYANALGLNAEEVIGNAKKMAEVSYKENRFASDLNYYSGGNEMKRNLILNQSQIGINRMGQRELQINGKGLGEISEKEWRDIFELSGKDDTELLRDQAQQLRSINESISGGLTTTIASFAKGLQFDKNAGDIIKNIDRLSDTTKDVAENLGIAVGDLLNRFFATIESHKGIFIEIKNGIIALSKATTKIGDAIDEVKKNSAAILAILALFKFRRSIFGGGGASGGSAGAAGAGAAGAGAAGAGAAGAAAGAGANAVNGNRTPGRWELTVGPNKGKYTKTVNGEWLDSGGNVVTDPKTLNQLENQTRAIKAGSVKKGGTGAAGSTTGSTAANTVAKPSVLKNSLKTGAKVGAKAGAVAAVIETGFAGYETWANNKEYKDKKEKILNDKELTLNEKAQKLSEEKLEKQKGNRGAWGNAAGATAGVTIGTAVAAGIAGAIKGATAGATAGSVVPGAGNVAGGIVGAIGGLVVGSLGAWLLGNAGRSIGESMASENSAKVSQDEVKRMIEENNRKQLQSAEPHAHSGIVGGTSYSGDKVLTRLNSRELTLSMDDQVSLFNFIKNLPTLLRKVGAGDNVTYYNAYDSSNRSFHNIQSTKYLTDRILSTMYNSPSNVIASALEPKNIIPTPFGGNSFRPIPNGSTVERYNEVKEVSVKDINLNVNGTIRLDSGIMSKSININELLSDTSFMSSLKEIIKNSINNDMNGGRFMNDNATLRGGLTTATYWG